MYRRNRYYGPAAGRFTQEDPAGLAGGINLYGYANGNVLNFSDPFGLKKDCKQIREELSRKTDLLAKRVNEYNDAFLRGDADLDHLNALNDLRDGYKNSLQEYKDSGCYDDDDHDNVKPTLKRGQAYLAAHLLGAPQLTRNPTKNPRIPMLHTELAPRDATAAFNPSNAVALTAAAGGSVLVYLLFLATAP